MGSNPIDRTNIELVSLGFCLGSFVFVGIICIQKYKNTIDNKRNACYYIYVAYDGNKVNRACGSGGTADALASGASGGNPVEVQILSTAPMNFGLGLSQAFFVLA